MISGATFGGVAAGAAASRTSAPKVIYACAARQNGAVRLVAKPSKCALTETRVSWNRAGIAGRRGATGATGGPAGFVGVRDVSQLVIVPGSSSLLKDVSCPTGTVPPGGGAHFSNVFSGRGSAGGAYVSESDVDDSGTGWAATLVNNLGSRAEFRADAICGRS